MEPHREALVMQLLPSLLIPHHKDFSNEEYVVNILITVWAMQIITEAHHGWLLAPLLWARPVWPLVCEQQQVQTQSLSLSLGDWKPLLTSRCVY